MKKKTKKKVKNCLKKVGCKKISTLSCDTMTKAKMMQTYCKCRIMFGVWCCKRNEHCMLSKNYGQPLNKA